MRCFACAAAMVMAACVTSQAQDAKSLAARVELHAIPSLTISDPQFLAGDANGTPATVGGEFRLAQGAGKLPVVVLMHGSGGIGANVEFWAREFNAMGISTFAIDGFTGRGLVSVNADQARLGRLNFILDIYRALDILAKHPRVDPARIALMGFSRGGQAVLYASVKRFHDLWNRSGVDFAVYVPLYPDCATTYLADTQVSASPIRLFHGSADDYNPVASCKRYVERLRAAGADVALSEFAGAHHGYDNPLGAVPAAPVKDAQTVRACTIREEPKGVLVNAASNQPFTYKDACVERDPHVGLDVTAMQATRTAVTSLLRATFKLP